MTASTETVAFRMTLNRGQEAEYRRRHDAIWPELTQALSEAGVVDYRIFLDEATGALFAVLTRRLDHDMDALPQLPVMRRWWAMMADIMRTKPVFAPGERPPRRGVPFAHPLIRRRITSPYRKLHRWRSELLNIDQHFFDGWACVLNDDKIGGRRRPPAAGGNTK